MLFFIFLLFSSLPSKQYGGFVSGGSVFTGDFVDREIGEGDFVDRIGAGDFDDRCGKFVGIAAMGTGGTIGFDDAIGTGAVIGTGGTVGITGDEADGTGAVVVLGDLVAANGHICREGSSKSVCN